MKPVVVVYLREVARVRIIDQISARCISPSARIFVAAAQYGAGHVVPVVALRRIGIIGQNATGEIHVRSNVSVVAMSYYHTGPVVSAAAGVLVLDGVGAVVFASHVVFRLRWGLFLLHKLNRGVGCQSAQCLGDDVYANHLGLVGFNPHHLGDGRARKLFFKTQGRTSVRQQKQNLPTVPNLHIIGDVSVGKQLRQLHFCRQTRPGHRLGFCRRFHATGNSAQ